MGISCTWKQHKYQNIPMCNQEVFRGLIVRKSWHLQKRHLQLLHWKVLGYRYKSVWNQAWLILLETKLLYLCSLHYYCIWMYVIAVLIINYSKNNFRDEIIWFYVDLSVSSFTFPRSVCCFCYLSFSCGILM